MKSYLVGVMNRESRRNDGNKFLFYLVLCLSLAYSFLYYVWYNMNTKCMNLG